jgi:hypothetical protein
MVLGLPYKDDVLIKGSIVYQEYKNMLELIALGEINLKDYSKTL